MDGWRPRLGQAFDPLALELSVDEAYLLSLVDGRTSMDELCSRSGQPQAEVAAVLQRLIALGVVDGSDAPADLGGAFDLKASLALEGLFDEPGAEVDAGLAAIDDEVDDLDVDLGPDPGAAEPDTWDEVTSADNPVLAEPDEVEALDGLDLDAGFDGPSDPTEVGDGDELARLLETPAVEPLAGSVIATASPPDGPDLDLEPAAWDDDGRTPLQTDLAALGVEVASTLAAEAQDLDTLAIDALAVDGLEDAGARSASWPAETSTSEDPLTLAAHAGDARSGSLDRAPTAAVPPPGEAAFDDDAALAEFELSPATDPEAELSAAPPPPGPVRPSPRSLVAQPDDDDDDDDAVAGAGRPRSEGAWFGRRGAIAADGPEEDPEIVALPAGDPGRARPGTPGAASPTGKADALAATADGELAALLASMQGETAAGGGGLDAASVDLFDGGQGAGPPGVHDEATVLLLDGQLDEAADDEAIAVVAGSDGELDDDDDAIVVVAGSDGGLDDDDEEIVVVAGPDDALDDDDEEIVVVPGLDRALDDEEQDVVVSAAGDAAEPIEDALAATAEAALAALYDEGPPLATAPAAEDEGGALEIEPDPHRHHAVLEAAGRARPVPRARQETPPGLLDPPFEDEGPAVGEDAFGALAAAQVAGDESADVSAVQVIHDLRAQVLGDRPPSGEPAAPGSDEPVVEELPAAALMPIDDDDPPYPSLEIATQALSPGALVCFDDLRTMHLAERFNLVRTAEGDMLSALCLDPNPRVICELIAQPTFDIEHACLVARWQQSPDTLRELQLQGTKLQDPRVQSALLDNPHAPPEMLAPLMDIMAPAQLYHLCARDDLPHETRVSAAYALREAYALLAPQERVDLILGTDAACLLLAGLPLDEDTCDLLAAHKFESKTLASNLAQYPTTPLQVLQRLYMQPVVQDNLEIKALIRQHPHWPS